MSISAAQCRAARALVDMDQAALATAAFVSRSVIIDFEKGRRTPTTNNLNAIVRALEAAGIDFIDDGSPGVRLRASEAETPGTTE